jgi:EF-P beta-lysylation protein EpmB
MIEVDLDTNHVVTANENEWKQSLKNMVTSIEELASLIDFSSAQIQSMRQACALFPLRVTREYVARIQKGNLLDPLLLQILPRANEFDIVEGFSADPLYEKNYSPQPGLLHKYQGRVLIMLSGSCAIHCRYCFRREFPYSAHRLSPKVWQPTLTYIANDSSIEEVILSGGDPLLIEDDCFKQLLFELAAIPHLKRVRIHSRLPIVLPKRINNTLLKLLANIRFKVIMVIHCNHAQEIDDAVIKALHDLYHAGIIILNQAVLLKGINDTWTCLKQLAERLFDLNVSFYYLHLLDRVNGTAHFEVNEEQAKMIYAQLQASLPGYMIPKLVREQAGAKAKVIITAM